MLTYDGSYTHRNPTPGTLSLILPCQSSLPILYFVLSKYFPFFFTKCPWAINSAFLIAVSIPVPRISCVQSCHFLCHLLVHFQCFACSQRSSLNLSLVPHLTSKRSIQFIIWNTSSNLVCLSVSFTLAITVSLTISDTTTARGIKIFCLVCKSSLGSPSMLSIKLKLYNNDQIFFQAPCYRFP